MINFDQAEFHGKKNMCNWCGSENIEFCQKVLISDLPHKIYKCKDCKERTSKKTFGGNTVWSPAIKKKTKSGVNKHIIAGSR